MGATQRVRAILVAGCALVALAVFSAAREPTRIIRTSHYARDRVIVKFKPGTRPEDRERIRASVHALPMRDLRLIGASVLKLRPGEDVDRAIEALRASPLVEYAERDHLLHVHETFPNDPYFEDCWALHNTGQTLGEPDADIDAPEAWDITTGSPSVIVAVIDTGVDYDHPDLAANLWTNPGEIPGNGVDDDGNGYVDDVYGISVVDGVRSGDPWDDHGHGTHVAGTLGAVGNNDQGIAGVNWTVRIMALKFLDSTGYGYESDAATCIEYAIAHGARVLNNSYGGTEYSQALYDAIAAANAAGVLFCASAGNESMDNDYVPSYPASYDLPNIIAVASTGSSDELSYFSNYGRRSVHVGAPGELILSTWPGNDYQYLDGTSMACPFVSGIAALLLAHEPGLTMTQLRDRVMWTGDPLFDLKETTVTGLRVNAYKALMGIYAVRIDSTSPLPSGKVGVPYSLALQATGFAPPFAWSWSAPEYAEREVANGFTWGGSPRYWQADNRVWRYDLPITFPFYGQNYTRAWVCSNGYIEFAAAKPSPEDVPDMTIFKQKKMIAVYWSDLTTDDYAGGLDIFTWQPDANSVAIRWQAQEADWLLGTPVNCTIVLHSDGRIEMHYGPDIFSLVGGLVGISAGDGVNYRLSYAKTNKLDLAWAPTSLWLPGALPPGLVLNAATGEISGTPTTSGTYDFDITVEDDSGGSDTGRFMLKIFPAAGPVADFTAAPRRGNYDLEVTFTDLSTSDTGITNWLWNFGDAQTSTAQNPTHVYTSPGTFTVALTVTDASGTDTMTKLRYVEVLTPGPIVDFYADPTSGPAPLTVTFYDLTQPSNPGDPDAEPWLWEWDFGDGQMEWRYDNEPFQHVYENPGVYDVTLAVSDWYGTTIRTKEAYITVTAPQPVLGISVTPDAFDFGVVEPGAVVNNNGSPLAVKNVGTLALDIGLRIRDEDDRDEWIAGFPDTNMYQLSSRLAPTMGTFGPDDILSTIVQWADGVKFGGGGKGMSPGAAVNQWFELRAPTAVSGPHAAERHAITVEVSCREAP